MLTQFRDAPYICAKHTESLVRSYSPLIILEYQVNFLDKSIDMQEDARALWELSEKLTGQEFNLSSD
jgi:hypothetical protein